MPCWLPLGMGRCFNLRAGPAPPFRGLKADLVSATGKQEFRNRDKCQRGQAQSASKVCLEGGTTLD